MRNGTLQANLKAQTGTALSLGSGLQACGVIGLARSPFVAFLLLATHCAHAPAIQAAFIHDDRNDILDTLGDRSGKSTLSRDFPVARGALSGMFGDRQDHVAAADEGSPNSSCLQYVRTKGAREGVATLTAPTTP